MKFIYDVSRWAGFDFDMHNVANIVRFKRIKKADEEKNRGEYVGLDADGSKVGSFGKFDVESLATVVVPAAPGSVAIEMWPEDNGHVGTNAHQIVAWRIHGCGSCEPIMPSRMMWEISSYGKREGNWALVETPNGRFYRFGTDDFYDTVEEAKAALLAEEKKKRDEERKKRAAVA